MEVFDLMMAGIFIMSFGFGWIIAAIFYFIRNKIRTARVRRYAAKIKEETMKEIKNLEKPTGELFIRDKEGKMFSVQIIVDPEITDPPADDKELRQMLVNKKSGKAHIEDMEGNVICENLEVVDKFVFTEACIKQIKEMGMEPEDIVINMLRASGRIN